MLPIEREDQFFRAFEAVPLGNTLDFAAVQLALPNTPLLPSLHVSLFEDCANVKRFAGRLFLFPVAVEIDADHHAFKLTVVGYPLIGDRANLASLAICRIAFTFAPIDLTRNAHAVCWRHKTGGGGLATRQLTAKYRSLNVACARAPGCKRKGDRLEAGRC